MWVDAQGKTATVYYNSEDMGSIDLQAMLGEPRSGSHTPETAPSEEEAILERSLSGSSDPAEHEHALHFVVDLGIDGQELEIIEHK
jgi:hypothetical protein